MIRTRLLLPATVAHVVLLVAPVAALGRDGAMARPEAGAILVVLLGLAAAEALCRRRPDPTRLGAPGTWLALASAIALLVTGWLALGWPTPGGGPAAAWWHWLGVPVAASGVALRAAAIRALGDAFTGEIVRPRGLRIVRTGIYRRLRHPSEVGLGLVAAGVATLGASAAAAAVALLALVPTAAARIAAEERVLARPSAR
jgi:protein-S-isoprenylcysteine O-methyltransferase Ste14